MTGFLELEDIVAVPPAQASKESMEGKKQKS
jgi:hypothetical protein